MSISTAMLAGTASLEANASALAAVSDNIANSNTVGYKRIRNDFTSLLNAQNAATSYNAGGIQSYSTAMVGEQGALQTSNVSTHMAISGGGFFITREQAANAQGTDQFFFTRAGQFSPDSDGYLSNTSGYYLYGWPVQADGTINSSSTDMALLEPVRITGLEGAAEATSNVSLTANLQASQTVSAAEAGYLPATNNMASGAVTPDFTATTTVFDSLGGSRTVTYSFLKSSAAANTWHVEAHIVPATDMDAAGLPDGQLATGTMVFTSTGQLDAVSSTFPTSITIGSSAAGAGGTGIAWAAGLGLAEQTIAFDFGQGSAPGGLTQFDQESQLTSSSVNGTSFGELTAVEVSDEGMVTALYSNGLSRNIYQIPVATFANPEGLSVQKGGVYAATTAAGSLIMSQATTGSAGAIASRALETSTVDLAEEFSNLIIIQRAYSASSKIITTADEMLDELIRIKR